MDYDGSFEKNKLHIDFCKSMLMRMIPEYHPRHLLYYESECVHVYSKLIGGYSEAVSKIIHLATLSHVKPILFKYTNLPQRTLQSALPHFLSIL